MTVESKKDLILLHGAIGSSYQFEELAQLLSTDFNCHLLNFNGHGAGAECAEMSIELFSETLVTFIQQNKLVKPLVFGYSMGGYVALYTESTHPGIVQSIITLGTKFSWSPEIAKHEIKLLNPEKIQEKIPQFASYLEKVHQPKDWKNVLMQTHGLMQKLGANPLLTESVLQTITIPITLCWGENDTMVTKEETQWAKTHLKYADFRVLAGVPHPIQMINSKDIQQLIVSEFSA